MGHVATATTRRHPVNQGILGKALSAFSRALSWLVLALIFSITTEWIGMTFFWQDQGRLHSQRMLARERGYLNEHFYRSVVTASPVVFADNVAVTLHHYLFEWTGIVDVAGRIAEPPAPDDSPLQVTLHALYIPLADYVQAAMTTTKVFGLRLAVLLLSMPAFALLAIVGVTDGLVERDLRRWGGGRESAFVYHHAKRLILPSLVAVWVFYLALPVSIHPNYIVLPVASLFAIALGTTAGAFKKYL